MKGGERSPSDHWALMPPEWMFKTARGRWPSQSRDSGGKLSQPHPISSLLPLHKSLVIKNNPLGRFSFPCSLSSRRKEVLLRREGHLIDFTGTPPFPPMNSRWVISQSNSNRHDRKGRGKETGRGTETGSGASANAGIWGNHGLIQIIIIVLFIL